jgi:hypothetical protein
MNNCVSNLINKYWQDSSLCDFNDRVAMSILHDAKELINATNVNDPKELIPLIEHLSRDFLKNECQKIIDDISTNIHLTSSALMLTDMSVDALRFCHRIDYLKGVLSKDYQWENIK